MVKKVMGLEITSGSIKVVELERDNKLIYLRGMGRISIPYQAIKDGEIVDIDIVSSAIRKLLAAAGVTAKKVVLSLSGKGVVIQEINLPSMPAAEMKEIIKSELEKYPIFQTNQFIFDYYPLSEFTEKGYKRVRVFFVGISSRLLSSYLRCMQILGLSVEGIDLASLSMVTSIYPDLYQDKTTALVLVRDEQTYVTVVKKGICCLFYNIDIGNRQLLPPKSDSKNKLNQENLEKFIDELERSFKFYQIEFGREKIAKVILSLDDSILPQLDKEIASMLEKETEVVSAEPLKQIKIPAKLANDKLIKNSAPAFSVAIGAALRGLKMIGHSLSLPLLQRYIPRKEKLRKRSTLIVVSSLLVVLISAVIYGYQQFRGEEYSNLLKEKKVELASVNTRLEGLKNLAQRHECLRERLQKQASYLKNLNRISWSMLLDKVTKQLPQDVWLKMFKTTDKEGLTLEGGTFSVDMVAEFIRQLGKEGSFENVNLDSLKQKRFSEEIEGVDFKLNSKLSTKKEKDDAKSEIGN